jgi:hypothetical protein
MAHYLKETPSVSALASTIRKLLKVTPAITTAVALDATGRERLKVSPLQIV